MKKDPLIFVVDDNPIILKLIEDVFKTIWNNIEYFKYGEDCLPQLTRIPDLIILDYIFIKKDQQVMSGLEILQHIRKINKKIPVIILSGQESGSAALDLMKLGIEDYIIKEGEFTSDLIKSVKNILEKEKL